jgi:alpha-glucuronidase
MEMLAARELQNYCQQMTGAEIPLRSSDDLGAESDGSVLIGLPSNHPHIGHLAFSRKIRNPDKSVEPEGFVIETLIDGGLSRLVITGRDPKGLMNGVRHLLQEVFGVNFNDNQRIPTRDNLTVPELSIALSPPFSIH